MFGMKVREQRKPGIAEEFWQAVIDYQNAEAKMNEVVDEKMIDAAIYEHQAACLRLGYFVEQAQQNGTVALPQGGNI
ncbi:MAG TPA: hypothetical protein VN426_06265 [Syntrophomonadaceae bacterium]|nr:hypothetical protein [Syntrophomonadaceae bacterium]